MAVVVLIVIRQYRCRSPFPAGRRRDSTPSTTWLRSRVGTGRSFIHLRAEPALAPAGRGRARQPEPGKQPSNSLPTGRGGRPAANRGQGRYTNTRWPRRSRGQPRPRQQGQACPSRSTTAAGQPAASEPQTRSRDTGSRPAGEVFVARPADADSGLAIGTSFPTSTTGRNLAPTSHWPQPPLQRRPHPDSSRVRPRRRADQKGDARSAPRDEVAQLPVRQRSRSRSGSAPRPADPGVTSSRSTCGRPDLAAGTVTSRPRRAWPHWPDSQISQPLRLSRRGCGRPAASARQAASARGTAARRAAANGQLRLPTGARCRPARRRVPASGPRFLRLRPHRSRTQADTPGHRSLWTTIHSPVRRSPPSTPPTAARIARAGPRVRSRRAPSPPRCPDPMETGPAVTATPGSRTRRIRPPRIAHLACRTVTPSSRTVTLSSPRPLRRLGRRTRVTRSPIRTAVTSTPRASPQPRRRRHPRTLTRRPTVAVTPQGNRQSPG